MLVHMNLIEYNAEFLFESGGTIIYGVKFIYRLFCRPKVNRATCACPNPSANLVGVMQAGAKPKGIGFPMSFFVLIFLKR
ncbi:hypothetical protein JCM16418A_36000 [Paenibacillus pini]|uniref:Uncharacterized protein n=1 Tax=Paenibacillus pini JCM 16418 TaxID=1236976 RepID=W7YM41_9BACL|nr:hypothetical protein JCM16418_2719 [Paenibacillus pini JCM 16418]